MPRGGKRLEPLPEIPIGKSPWEWWKPDPTDPTAPTGKAKYGGKITQVEKARRVEAIGTLLIKGYSRGLILEYVRNSTDWEVSRATVDAYIADATSEIESYSRRRLRYRLGRSTALMEHVQREAAAERNWSAVIRADRQLDRLHAIARRVDPVTPTDPNPGTTPTTDPPGPNHPLSVAQRANVVAELVKIAREREAAARASALTNGHAPDAN
jgi:hypothetical protein